MKTEKSLKHITDLIDQKLMQPKGLIILIGSNTSGLVEYMQGIAETFIQTKRKIFGLIDNGAWSPDDPVLNWPPKTDFVVMNPKVGILHPEEIEKLKGKNLSALIVDQIKDSMTAKAVINFSLNECLVVTSLRGEDAFSAIERLLDMGISRNQLFSTLSMVVYFERDLSGEIFFDVLDRWSSKK